jgi:hypothetical protein
VTPDQVFWWTTTVPVVGVVALVFGIYLIYQRTEMSVLVGMLLLFLGMVAPVVIVLLIEKGHPGEGALAHLLQTPQEREQTKERAALLQELERVAHRGSYICPHPSIFEIQNAELLAKWHAYHSSFLIPDSQGRECYRTPPRRSRLIHRQSV